MLEWMWVCNEFCADCLQLSRIVICRCWCYVIASMMLELDVNMKTVMSFMNVCKLLCVNWMNVCKLIWTFELELMKCVTYGLALAMYMYELSLVCIMCDHVWIETNHVMLDVALLLWCLQWICTYMNLVWTVFAGHLEKWGIQQRSSRCYSCGLFLK